MTRNELAHELTRIACKIGYPTPEFYDYLRIAEYLTECYPIETILKMDEVIYSDDPLFGHWIETMIDDYEFMSKSERLRERAIELGIPFIDIKTNN